MALGAPSKGYAELSGLNMITSSGREEEEDTGVRRGMSDVVNVMTRQKLVGVGVGGSYDYGSGWNKGNIHRENLMRLAEDT